MKLFYCLTTVDPVIVSQSNATISDHNTHDFIPGSAILGAVAGQLYNQLDSETAWHIFHSGMVQFAPCYPLVEGEVALPIPASWHIAKEHMSGFQAATDLAKVVNINHIGYDRGMQQFKRLPLGFVTASGALADVKTAQVTKTAINQETGVAESGQLFSYSFIEKAQRFIGWVEVDDAHAEVVEKALLSISRIGRAKNTEFGRVSIESVDAQCSQPIANAQQLVLWCISDCEFFDAFGQSGLAPTGEMLGSAFTGLQLNLTRSVIQSETRARFNRARGSFDSQTQVISKGSLLVFDVVGSAPTHADIIKLANEGVGINKQLGQGWVMANPNWWSLNHLSELPLFTPITLSIATQPSEDSQPKSLLTHWVQERVELAKHTQQNAVTAFTLFKSVVSCYVDARRYQDALAHTQLGPSKTQWQLIGEQARSEAQTWQQKVFGVHEDRICKSKNDETGWGLTWESEVGIQTFENAMEQLLAPHSAAVILKLLEHLEQYDLSFQDGLEGAELAIKRRQGDCT